MLSVYDINLDVQRNGQQAKINARKGDNRARMIKARLNSNGETVDLTNASCRLFAKKPDDTSIYIDGAIVDNTIEITFTQQMCTAEGIVEADIQVIQGGRTIYSPSIIIQVEDTAYDESAVESTDEWTALENMTGDIITLKSNVQTLNVKAETLENGKVDKETGKGLSTNDYTDAEKSTLAALHAAMPGVQQNIAQLQSGKVDKVTGKGLSTNDYTDFEKSTLANIHATMPEVLQNIASLQGGMASARSDITSLQSDMTTATGDISDLQEDMIDAQGYISDLQDDMTSAQGDISDLQSDKVDKVEGKGLSTNDYTTTEKNNLAVVVTEISNKANITDLAAVEAAKADKSQVNYIDGRLTTAEGNITKKVRYNDDSSIGTDQFLFTDEAENYIKNGSFASNTTSWTLQSDHAERVQFDGRWSVLMHDPNGVDRQLIQENILIPSAGEYEFVITARRYPSGTEGSFWYQLLGMDWSVWKVDQLRDIPSNEWMTYTIPLPALAEAKPMQLTFFGGQVYVTDITIREVGANAVRVMRSDSGAWEQMGYLSDIPYTQNDKNEIANIKDYLNSPYEDVTSSAINLVSNASAKVTLEFGKKVVLDIWTTANNVSALGGMTSDFAPGYDVTGFAFPGGYDTENVYICTVPASGLPINIMRIGQSGPESPPIRTRAHLEWYID